MKNDEIIRKILNHIFTNANFVSRSFIREKIDISNLQHSNEKRFSDLVFMNLTNLKILDEYNELNIKYSVIYSYPTIRINSIINIITPIFAKLIGTRTNFQELIRVPLKEYSIESEDDEASNNYANLFIQRYKDYHKEVKSLGSISDNNKRNKLILEVEDKYFEEIDIINMEGMDKAIDSIDIMQNTIIDLLDRLICNSNSTVVESYNFENDQNFLYQLVFKDIAFKEILFFILKDNEEYVSSKYIRDRLVQINVLLLSPIQGKRTLDKYKDLIVNVLFELEIFTGERHTKKKYTSYKVGPILSENFDKEWKMNAITKLESIKYIIGTLSNISNISQEQSDAALKIFNFTDKQDI